MWNSAARQPRAPVAQQHREPDHDSHRRRDARTEEPGESGQQTEVVATSDRAVVVGEQQLREAEHQRSHERDLERDENVLRARPEEHEARRGHRRQPRPHTRATHHGEQERRGREMQEHNERLVGRVAPDPEHHPEEPVRNDGQGRPVLVVGPEQITQVADRARRQEVPVVLREPAVTAPHQEQREGDHFDRDEAPQRGATRARYLVVSRRLRIQDFVHFVLASAKRRGSESDDFDGLHLARSAAVAELPVAVGTPAHRGTRQPAGRTQRSHRH